MATPLRSPSNYDRFLLAAQEQAGYLVDAGMEYVSPRVQSAVLESARQAAMAIAGGAAGAVGVHRALGGRHRQQVIRYDPGGV